MSDAATWQHLLEDEDALRKADPAWLAEQRERWPWFTAVPWLQARREVLLQGHATEASLRQAAAWSGERARLKSWLGGSLAVPDVLAPIERPAATEDVDAITSPGGAEVDAQAAESGVKADDMASLAEDQPTAESSVPEQPAALDEPAAEQNQLEEGEAIETAISGENDNMATLPETEPDLPAPTAESGVAAQEEAPIEEPSEADSPQEEATVEEPADADSLQEDASEEPSEADGPQEEIPVEEPAEAASKQEDASSVAPPAQEAPLPDATERHAFSDWLRRMQPAGPLHDQAGLVAASATERSSGPPVRMPAAQASDKDSQPGLAAAHTPRFEATEDFLALDGLIARQRRRTAASRSSESDPNTLTPAGEEDFPGPLTETWARILADQGKTPEAIAVYVALGLRQPEKSAFFAARIQELKAR